MQNLDMVWKFTVSGSDPDDPTVIRSIRSEAVAVTSGASDFPRKGS